MEKIAVKKFKDNNYDIIFYGHPNASNGWHNSNSEDKESRR